MKSGTNWIGGLLNLHPQISCIGEFHWENLYQTLQKDLRVLPIMQQVRARTVVRRNFQAMVKRTVIELADPMATVIGERTPHTIKPIVIKGAPQITIIRDGRDVLVSRIFHLLNFPEVSRVFDRFPDMRFRLEKFRDDPWYFRDHPHELFANEMVVRESMRWWKEHLQSDRRTIANHPNVRVLVLQYEDFHSNLEANRRRMYQFLRVDPDQAKPVPQKLQPGHKQERPTEFNRKGQIGDWKNYITDDARKWINDEAGDELLYNGYIESLQW